MTTLQEKLLQICACEECVIWLGERSLREFWRDCPRVDWLFEIAYKMIGEEDCPTEQDILTALYQAIAPFVYAFSENDKAITAIESVRRCAHDLTNENRAASKWVSWESVSDAASRAASDAASEARNFILETVRESFLEAIGM